MPAPSTVPTLRSIPTADGVADLVRRQYDLDVTACTLMRSFVNEVYEIRTTGQRFVLKLYQHGGWSVDEVGWEAELVDHLVSHQIPAAAVVRLSSGAAVGEITAPEGVRPFLLSEYIEGGKPQPPFDDALYRSYGRLIARLHQAGDSFRTDRYRRPFDLDRTLDEPLAQVLPSLADQPDDRRRLQELADTTRRRLTTIAGDLDRGVRHGDVTMDNVHSTDAGLIVHDFDLADVGWRMADLSNCLATPFADAFLEGYTGVRAVGPADLQALPWLRVVESIKNLAFHLTEKTTWRGTESLAEGWVTDGFAELRKCADRLL